MNFNTKENEAITIERIKQGITDLRAIIFKTTAENRLISEHYKVILKARNDERAALLQFQIPWEYNKRVQSLLQPE